MNARHRRGACPALFAPMLTGDGLLVRLSPVSGALSSKQLIGLCESAARHGNSIVEVTARGSLQFRGFSPLSATRFASEVDALGIAVRTGVPVETSPLAGMDPTEIADPFPLAEAVRMRIAQAGLSGRLGPKVSLVVDGSGAIAMGSIAADVRLTAEIDANEVFWRLAIGGDAATATSLDCHDPAAAIDAVLAILLEIAALGIEARGRDLVSLLSSPSPGQDEPTGAGKTPANLENPQNTFASISLNSGQSALPVALPFGHTDAYPLTSLARTAESFGVAEIRPAPDRRLLLICPTQAAVTELRTAAGGFGFIVNSTDIRASIAACAGAPTCASGTIPARTLAQRIATAIGVALDPSMSIHISGCEKGCARQATASITIVGRQNGVGIVVGGTARDVPTEYTPASSVVQAVERLVAAFRDQR